MAEKIVCISVKDEVNWPQVMVDNHTFIKGQSVERAASGISDEIRNSPLLDVVEVKVEPPVKPPVKPPTQKRGRVGKKVEGKDD